MNDNALATRICETALQLGYDKCGIIRYQPFDLFLTRLEQRIQAVPESRAFYDSVRKKALSDEHPWAKAIVVCVSWHGHFRVPARLRGLYARAYLFDGRTDPNSPGFQRRERFNQELARLGVRFQTEPHFDIVPMRPAAELAGLGILRRNNFFYTEKGSYLGLEAWLIDSECERLATHSVKPCLKRCHLCQTACKTQSLSSAYTMNPFSCVSFLNTFGGGQIPAGLTADNLGMWVHGCDDCQSACPFNRQAETSECDFPGLAELEDRLVPENLCRLGDRELRETVQPKLWYIPPERVEQFRNSAQRVLRYRERAGVGHPGDVAPNSAL